MPNRSAKLPTGETNTDVGRIVMPLLELVAKHELHGMLFWTYEDEQVQFCLNCNDLFFWGSADAEGIETEADIRDLETAINDCVAIDPICGTIYGCDLYCARRRKMRPQGCCYPEKQTFWPLFNACGPERPTGFGNPYAPGQQKPCPRYEDLLRFANNSPCECGAYNGIQCARCQVLKIAPETQA